MSDVPSLLIKLLFISILAVYGVENLMAQHVSFMDAEEIVEQFIADEEASSWSVDNMSEELAYYQQHPLNVNTATKEELEKFPFLTDLQIENLLFYCYVTGGMKTIYELQLVDDWDRQTIAYFLPFVYVGPVENQSGDIPLRMLFKRGKQELSARVSFPFHQPKDVDKWEGSKLYHSFRYGFRSKNQLYFGLAAEKDAGEPFFHSYNKKGYDSYSFYFLLKDRGFLKALALGRYRLRFGMGLVMNGDFGIGKSASIATLGYKSGGINKHSSTDETNYLQGAAATFKAGRFLFTGFYSFKKHDAIVENKLITSLKTDGYHRTELDISKRNKAAMHVSGANIKYVSPYFEIGLTGVYNVFNKVYKPVYKPYGLFYPKGKHFVATGVDYKWRWNRMLFCGETAFDWQGGVASLHLIRFSPVPDYQVILVHRYYNKKYNAWFANSLSEGGIVRGETGYYLAVEAVPFRSWKIFAYVDWFRFPWLRYGVDRPSNGLEGLVQLSYLSNKNWSLSLRYQYKNKEKNCSNHSGEVVETLRHKWRCQFSYEPSVSVSLRTVLDYVIYRSPHLAKKHGEMFSQQFIYRFQQVPFQLAVHFSLFNTDDYNTRLTTYERGMLYTFSFPSFYGKGMRASLLMNYSFNKKLTVLLKAAQTVYKETILTGVRPRQTVLDCQIRWKF